MHERAQQPPDGVTYAEIIKYADDARCRPAKAERAFVRLCRVQHALHTEGGNLGMDASLLWRFCTIQARNMIPPVRPTSVCLLLCVTTRWLFYRNKGRCIYGRCVSMRGRTEPSRGEITDFTGTTSTLFYVKTGGPCVCVCVSSL